MKKILSVLLALCLLAVVPALTFAEGENTTVLVTVYNGTGNVPQLVLEEVSVTDADGDGVVSISDALYCAHESAYTGGAAEGYSAVSTEYGISLVKLWGVENGGSYGYFLNNASPLSLLDPVQDGDSIYAYAYQDLDTWSDMYTWLEVDSFEAGNQGTKVSLTLYGLSYDENWNPVTVPVEGAQILVNGEVSDAALTDGEGKTTVTLSGSGDFVVTVRSDSATLVPAVQEFNVAAANGGLIRILPWIGAGLGIVILWAVVFGIVMAKRKK